MSLINFIKFFYLGDIIIERWIPYGAAAKRKTIVQRAEAAKEYAKPRNVIIQYEPVQVRIVRQFERLGVTQANPQAYLQQYGAQLLDAQTLLQQARAAGVVEDIVSEILFRYMFIKIYLFVLFFFIFYYLVTTSWCYCWIYC